MEKTFPQYYKAQLAIYKYRGQLCKSHYARHAFRERIWNKWQRIIESEIEASIAIRPLVFDSWIRTVAKMSGETQETAESAFQRHFRGVLDYTKSCPGYLTPSARKWHKEHRFA